MRNIYQEKIESFYKDEKRMPSYSEMMELFSLKSKNAIYKIVNKLVESGMVAKDHIGRLIPTDNFTEINTSMPMLGYVTAGFPSSIEEELLDRIKLDDFLIRDKEQTYMLEVDRNCMIEAHIEKGDMLLVERANVAKDGQIVIAEVDGEFTLKYFRKSGNKFWLEPANKNYKPIYPVHSLNINAVLKAVIRKY